MKGSVATTILHPSNNRVTQAIGCSKEYATAAAAKSPQGHNTKLTVVGGTIRKCIIRHAGDKCRYVTYSLTITLSNVMFVVACQVALAAASFTFAISVMSLVVVSVTRLWYSCNLDDIISCCFSLVIVIFVIKTHSLHIYPHTWRSWLGSIRNLAYTLHCDCSIAWIWPWTPRRSRTVSPNISKNDVAILLQQTTGTIRPNEK